MRILLVDDQRIFVHMIGALLRERGAEVIEASNGVEALEAERKEPPDCIISDILMPLMDGLTLCRECKTDDRLRNIPFLMATATFPEEDGLRISEDVGADGFLLKAQEPGTFMRQIDEAIQRCQSSKWRRGHCPENIGQERGTRIRQSRSLDHQRTFPDALRALPRGRCH